jgi:hypothetical protein
MTADDGPRASATHEVKQPEPLGTAGCPFRGTQIWVSVGTPYQWEKHGLIVIKPILDDVCGLKAFTARYRAGDPWSSPEELGCPYRDWRECIVLKCIQ